MPGKLVSPIRRAPGLGRPLASTSLAGLAALAAAVAWPAAWAGPPQPTAGGTALRADYRLPFPRTVYAERRRRLAEKLSARLEPGEHGWLLLRGMGREADLDDPRQRPDFLYLTGVDVAGASMVLKIGSGERAEVLFLHDPTAHERTYDRPPLVPGRLDWEAEREDPERRSAREATGFASIKASHRLEEWLKPALAGAQILFVAVDPVSAETPLTPGLDLVARLRDRHPGLRIVNARPALDELRLLKDGEEIASIDAAVQATIAGFRRAARLVRPGTPESAVQAEMEAAFRTEGAQALAFPTIVAAGRRATILHYMRNEGVLEDAALVIIDAGAQKDGYAADVTRTFPVSGRFNAEQRQAYDAVIEAQEAGLRAARLGATLEEIDRVVRAELKKAGYAEGIRHGCCHYVGLEVHDVGADRVPLAEGMVFTIEPGIYFPKSGLGIRVEDTVVMDADGVRSLSGALPRRAEEVERFLSGARE